MGLGLELKLVLEHLAVHVGILAFELHDLEWHDDILRDSPPVAQVRGR